MSDPRMPSESLPPRDGEVPTIDDADQPSRHEGNRGAGAPDDAFESVAAEDLPSWPVAIIGWMFLVFGLVFVVQQQLGAKVGAATKNAPAKTKIVAAEAPPSSSARRTLDSEIPSPAEPSALERPPRLPATCREFDKANFEDPLYRKGDDRPIRPTALKPDESATLARTYRDLERHPDLRFDGCLLRLRRDCEADGTGQTEAVVCRAQAGPEGEARGAGQPCLELDIAGEKIDEAELTVKLSDLPSPVRAALGKAGCTPFKTEVVLRRPDATTDGIAQMVFEWEQGKVLPVKWYLEADCEGNSEVELQIDNRRVTDVEIIQRNENAIKKCTAE